MWNEKKQFEVRNDDRKYKVGDFLVLKEYKKNVFTGRQITALIEYKLEGGKFGIKDGYCVLSIKFIRKRRWIYKWKKNLC